MPWKNPLILQNEWLCSLGVLLEVLLFSFTLDKQSFVFVGKEWIVLFNFICALLLRMFSCRFLPCLTTEYIKCPFLSRKCHTSPV